MSIFYISADVDGKNYKYMLDSTSKVQVSNSGKLTKHPIQNGANVSDHYTNNNIEISFSGRISDIKSYRNPTYVDNFVEGEGFVTRKASFDYTIVESSNVAATAQSYIRGLQELKNDKIPFTISVGNIETYINCMFTNFSVMQDSSVGTIKTSEGDLDCFIISFTAEQIRFGDRAKVDKIRPEFVKTEIKEDIVNNTKKAGLKTKLNQSNLETVQRKFDEGLLRGF